MEIHNGVHCVRSNFSEGGDQKFLRTFEESVLFSKKRPPAPEGVPVIVVLKNEGGFFDEEQ